MAISYIIPTHDLMCFLYKDEGVWLNYHLISTWFLSQWPWEHDLPLGTSFSLVEQRQGKAVSTDRSLPGICETVLAA